MNKILEKYCKKNYFIDKIILDYNKLYVKEIIKTNIENKQYYITKELLLVS